MDEEEMEERGEGEEEGEEEEVEEAVLTKEIAGESLSLLAKTGNGMAHAYVRMDLRDKKLTDIGILSCYVHVRYLDISGNNLTDMSSLNALPQLLSVRADKNKITSPKLQEMQYLQILSLAGNRLISTGGIAHPLLETLNLSSNQITELADLDDRHLPSVRSLDLHGNQLSSVAGIQLPSLQKLYIASNKLSSLEGLSSLRQLTTLHARDNQVASLEGLTPSMAALQYLNLRSNHVADNAEVVKLRPLPLLRGLVLADCPISEIDDYRLEVLVALPKLERLDKEEFTEDERADSEEVSQERQAAAAAEEDA
ncbi:Leucine-rich repeat-containing protein 23 [Geodia barretti]|uniref:Leucine-rich repeat-containing protein 23 n=1 Tax=Geodia barretti TaxID=519541 RepID=A0AA35XFS1_GEOBA|nr:Leucine-rich repeat-containing protein 23 [Geodia barretti]